jgi:hypothetical protein
MTRIISLALAAAVICLPAIADAQGKSETAPGRTTDPKKQAPGHTSDPKANAPGQQKEPGESAKKYAPGQDQKSAPNPSPTKK